MLRRTWNRHSKLQDFRSDSIRICFISKRFFIYFLRLIFNFTSKQHFHRIDYPEGSVRNSGRIKLVRIAPQKLLPYKNADCQTSQQKYIFTNSMRISTFFTFLYSTNAQKANTATFKKIQKELREQNPERWRHARWQEKQNSSLGIFGKISSL